MINKQSWLQRYTDSSVELELSLYNSSDPRVAITSPTTAAPTVDAENATRTERGAPLTFAPVRFDGDELPYSWKLRKYACTSEGGAHDESLPPKNVESQRPPIVMSELERYCSTFSSNALTLL